MDPLAVQNKVSILKKKKFFLLNILVTLLHHPDAPIRGRDDETSCYFTQKKYAIENLYLKHRFSIASNCPQEIAALLFCIRSSASLPLRLLS